MSDSREDFEQAVEDKWSDSYSFTRFGDEDYYDEIVEGMWRGWQASRQALEGEPVGTARRCGYDRDITYCEFEADEVPIGTKLYTHPASRQAVSVPEETLTAIHDTLRLVWSRELSADDGMDEIEILIPPTKTDEWIKCSERLPKESDGDCHGIVWVYNKGLSWVEISDLEDVKFISDYTHWMPTNLVRPEPPKQEKDQ